MTQSILNLRLCFEKSAQRRTFLRGLWQQGRVERPWYGGGRWRQAVADGGSNCWGCRSCTSRPSGGHATVHQRLPSYLIIQSEVHFLLRATGCCRGSLSLVKMRPNFLWICIMYSNSIKVMCVATCLLFFSFEMQATKMHFVLSTQVGEV